MFTTKFNETDIMYIVLLKAKGKHCREHYDYDSKKQDTMPLLKMALHGAESNWGKQVFGKKIYIYTLKCALEVNLEFYGPCLGCYLVCMHLIFHLQAKDLYQHYHQDLAGLNSKPIFLNCIEKKSNFLQQLSLT